MEIHLSQIPLAEIETDWLVIGWVADADPGPQVAALDTALSGQLSQLRESGDLQGKLGEVLIDPHVPEIAARRLCVVGLGPAESLGRAVLQRAIGAAALAISKNKSRSVACALPELDTSLTTPAMVEAVVTSLMIGGVGPGLYRAEPDRYPFTSITVAATADRDAGELQQGIERGRIVGQATNLTRELVNRPAGDVYPETFADRAGQLASEVGLECDILDQPRIEAERMGSLLAVAQGSSRPPRVVVLRHNGGEAGAPTIALVGKGVTFDSGGLSLKPSEGMKSMKADMAGAATVLGVMTAIARLKLPVNVIGLMGLVENMVSGNSYKLGDVLTARNGVTIEVLNTDAEGRLVLADVLSYAVDQKVDRMIDLATLTGACVIALGEDFVGAFTNNEPWCQEVLAATRRAGEQIWQMPMDESFSEQLISDVADCKNVGKRWGGAITAAKFLEKFVGETPWVHLDIAGPAFAEAATPVRASGATGVMVRSLVDLLSNSGGRS
jgi:leucyl aminopeptidase